MFFDHDPDTFPDDDPKSEDAMIDDWLDLIELGLSTGTLEAQSDTSILAEELERAKSALQGARSKRRR